MNKTTFDQNGIFASDAKLTAIALQVLEQEKRERELRREWFASGMIPAPPMVDSGASGTSATATDSIIV